MSEKIGVLVVDDSAVVRRLIESALAEDPAFEVTGTAPNGKVALAKLAQRPYDIVVLDVEMPELDGLATLTRIRQAWPKLPVVMFSAATVRAASVTIEALSLGATDYVTKPAATSAAAARERVVHELLPKLKAICGERRAPRPRTSELPRRLESAALAAWGRASVVAIGVSTGGPNALDEVLSKLPADLATPVLVVQHVPADFVAPLVQRLDRVSPLPVAEAGEGTRVEPGRIWLAPGDQHLEVVKRGADVFLHLHRGPLENSCRPAVDVLFRSVASVYGARALAIVLTGMGQDGLLGARRLRDAGAVILAQDQATSVVWGMPGAIARAGLADRVLPLGDIAAEIGRRAARGAAAAGGA